MEDVVPIHGRIVNTEGQPVAGARVAVDRFWYNDEGNLDAWEAAATEDKADFYSLRQHTPQVANGPQMRSVIPDVMTDADGRFVLRGIGRERVTQLLISGPGIETNQVKAGRAMGRRSKSQTRHSANVVPIIWRPITRRSSPTWRLRRFPSSAGSPTLTAVRRS